MEAFLVAIGEILIEFVLNVAIFGSIDGIATQWKVLGRNFVLLLVGGGLGALSLLVFSRTIISVPALRIAYLVAAPIGAAFLFRALAARRAKKSYSVVPREHFWHAFWFTLGWVVVRFVFAQRG
jgi:hypothetical protein